MELTASELHAVVCDFLVCDADAVAVEIQSMDDTVEVTVTEKALDSSCRLEGELGELLHTLTPDSYSYRLVVQP